MRDPYRSCAPDVEVLAKSASTMELFNLVARGEISPETAAEVMMVQRQAARYRMGWLDRFASDVARWMDGATR